MTARPPRDHVAYAAAGTAQRAVLRRAVAASVSQAARLVAAAIAIEIGSYSRVSDGIYRDHLAEVTGLDLSTIRRAIRELVDAGVIVRRHVHGSRAAPIFELAQGAQSPRDKRPPQGAPVPPDGPSLTAHSSSLHGAQQPASRGGCAPLPRSNREDFREEAAAAALAGEVIEPEQIASSNGDEPPALADALAAFQQRAGDAIEAGARDVVERAWAENWLGTCVVLEDAATRPKVSSRVGLAVRMLQSGDHLRRVTRSATAQKQIMELFR